MKPSKSTWIILGSVAGVGLIALSALLRATPLANSSKHSASTYPVWLPKVSSPNGIPLDTLLVGFDSRTDEGYVQEVAQHAGAKILLYEKEQGLAYFRFPPRQSERELLELIKKVKSEPNVIFAKPPLEQILQ